MVLVDTENALVASVIVIRIRNISTVQQRIMFDGCLDDVPMMMRKCKSFVGGR
jgi:hypothetical protein